LLLSRQSGLLVSRGIKLCELRRRVSLVASPTEWMLVRSESIQRWWPTTQSLDIVEGTIETVAKAVQTEILGYVKGEAVRSSWQKFANLDAAFRAAPTFANVPTFFLVLPTPSRWSVLWNNSFLCDGYDSLCWCLTKNHGLTSIHWSAHDAWTTSQSGADFYYRSWDGHSVIERSVCCAQEDRRWWFFQSGEALPEEDLRSYEARRKRDRLNEQQLTLFLGRLGAHPWSEEYYDLAGRSCFVVERTAPPSSVILRPREEVVPVAG
jgi:hypothetical protein